MYNYHVWARAWAWHSYRIWNIYVLDIIYYVLPEVWLAGRGGQQLMAMKNADRHSPQENFWLRVYHKEEKNKSSWRVTTTVGKMYWTSEGKIYFTMRFIKTYYSLLKFYHPLKIHKIPFLEGAGEEKLR